MSEEVKEVDAEGVSDALGLDDGDIGSSVFEDTHARLIEADEFAERHLV